MSYLETVAGKLEDLMRTHGLDNEVRERIGAFFREKVLESFRNGVEKGGARSTSRNDKPTRKGPARPTR